MICLENLSVVSSSFRLDRISLTVPTTGYAVLMGVSGAGKTTLLEAICGLRNTPCGKILIDSVDVTGLPANCRAIGYVPQDAALFPTMNVAEHFAFPLRIRRRSTVEIADRVAKMADRMGLANATQRMPHQLSGGEKQRVALGRALVFEPRTLLLDEPLSALDDGVREQMRDLLRQVHQAKPLTVLHVTHRREDAESLTNVLFRLEDGRIVKDG